MIDQSRREMIKRIVKGTVYVAPVVATMAAPGRLMAQGGSDPGSMFCDYYPILCPWFGGSSAFQQAPSSAPAPGVTTSGQPQAPGAQPAPWERPPPGSVTR